MPSTPSGTGPACGAKLLRLAPGFSANLLLPETVEGLNGLGPRGASWVCAKHPVPVICPEQRRLSQSPSRRLNFFSRTSFRTSLMYSFFRYATTSPLPAACNSGKISFQTALNSSAVGRNRVQRSACKVRARQSSKAFLLSVPCTALIMCG